MSRALDGVTVVDFSQLMQGPWATQKLADMGADVVKVEPLSGEYERAQAVGGDLLDGLSPWYLAMNRNKRSVAVDLKTDEGHAVAADLTATADVVVENFRPGVMDRLGLGYEDVRERNPDVVYVSGSGFGTDGPYADRPAQDLLVQGATGLATLGGGADDPPTPAGTFVADQLSALNIALHTVIALYHRELTGEGQRVRANLLNSLFDGLCQEVTAALNLDREFERGAVAHPFLGAPYGVYETADGHVAISLGDVRDVGEALGVDALAGYETDADQFDHRDEIHALVESHTRERESEPLLEALRAADVWCGPVNDLAAAAADPQIRHNDMVVEVDHPDLGSYETTGVPVDMSETPGEIRSPPPAVGEHTEEVLASLGYDAETVARLVEDGAVATPERGGRGPP